MGGNGRFFNVSSTFAVGTWGGSGCGLMMGFGGEGLGCHGEFYEGIAHVGIDCFQVLSETFIG